MQSFQRAFPLFSIVVATGLIVGCGGPGTPIPGGSDPAKEAADAALAPEGVPASTGAEGDKAGGATESDEASTPKEASAPESGS